jgi:hypothetical protein
MDEKDIENIITKTLDERKKRNVSKVFHDPEKAESVAIFAFLTGFGLAVVLMSIFFFDYIENESFTDIVLEKLDCEEIKKLYEEPKLLPQQSILQKYLFSKCL